MGDQSRFRQLTGFPLLHGIVLILIGVTGVVVLVCMYANATPRPPGIKDFMNLYAGAKLVGTPDLYDESKEWALQDTLVGRHSLEVPFSRLPFVAVLCKPLTLFSYEVALKIWYAVLALSLGLFVLLFPVRPLTTAALACWSIPVGAAFFNAQDTPLMLVWIALCLRFQKAGKPFLAGMIFALCLVKFNFLLLIPLMFFIQRLWRLLLGFLTGSTVLLAISFAAQGPSWPYDYLHLLQHGHIQNALDLMFNIFAAFLPSPHALAYHILGSVAVAGVVALICWRAQFDIALASCLLGGLLVSIHTYNQDYVLALPICALLLSHKMLVPLALIFSSPAAYLSTRVAVSLAFIVLVLIAITVWVNFRSRRAMPSGGIDMKTRAFA